MLMKPYVIGRRAQKAEELKEKVIVENEEIELKMNWINTVETSPEFKIKKVEEFGKKVMIARVDEKLFFIDLFCKNTI